MGELLGLALVGMIGLGLVVVFGIVLAVLKLVFGLILLPFRILGWLLVLPFLALKLVFGLLAGLSFLPLLVIGLLGGAFLMVVVPLMPFLLLAGLAWLVFSGMRGPAAAAGAVRPPLP